jgi:hypothetical protein
MRHSAARAFQVCPRVSTLFAVPTPVGPLGPGEFDPNDPDLWDWDPPPEPRPGWPRWMRVTAWLVVVAFALLVVASVAR